jgi:hypothetical protein
MMNKMLMKYPTGNTTGNSMDNIGEVRETEDGLVYIEESQHGGYYRVYGENAITMLKAKRTKCEKEIEMLEEAIDLLTSRVDGTN